jgi:hypothetical protein
MYARFLYVSCSAFLRHCPVKGKISKLLGNVCITCPILVCQLWCVVLFFPPLLFNFFMMSHHFPTYVMTRTWHQGSKVTTHVTPHVTRHLTPDVNDNICLNLTPLRHAWPWTPRIISRCAWNTFDIPLITLQTRSKSHGWYAPLCTAKL